MKSISVLVAVSVAIVSTLRAGDAAGTLEPVNFSKIIPLLPAAPDGWKGADPDGTTMDMGGFKMTTAGRTYTKGDGDEAPSVSINIIDCAGNKQFYDATTATWSFSQETPTGFMKSLPSAEAPGFESFDNASKSGQVWVVVAKRFFVHVETTNIEPAGMQVWMKMIDLKKLAALTSARPGG